MRTLFVLGSLICALVGWGAWEQMPPVPSAYVMEKIFTSASITFKNDQDVQGTCLFPQPITLEQASGPLKEVIVNTEDRDFYNHPYGVSLKGISAGVLSLFHVGHRGGSTITQQLVKLTLFQPHDNRLMRKIIEIPWTVVVSKRFTKDQILTFYINNIPFRHGLYGVEAASRFYFHRHAKDLNYFESALIEVMLSNPGTDIFSTDKSVLDKTYKKARNLIRSLAKKGLIAKVGGRDRQRENGNLPNLPEVCGYARDYVVRELKGVRPAGELRALVTFSPRRQIAAVQTLELTEEHLSDLGGSQMALVDLDRTGAILALQGGIDYTESQWDRASRGLRSPGSIGKIVVLAAACEAGYRLNSKVSDTPFASGRPKNDDGKYLGEIELWTAFVHSRNVPIYRLAQLVGPSRIAILGHRFGLKHQLPAGDKDGGMALGEFVASPLEVATVTAAIANGGYPIRPYAVRAVISTYGQMVYEHFDVVQPSALSSECVKMVDTAMRGVVTSGTGRKANIEQARGKTGTTSDYGDAWFSGYASSTRGSAVVTIWAGNDRGTDHMENVKGGNLPAKAFYTYVKQVDEIGLGRQVYIMPRSDREQLND